MRHKQVETFTVEDAIKAAQAHALSSGDPEYAIGDLEACLRTMWNMLSTKDKRVFAMGWCASDLSLWGGE